MLTIVLIDTQIPPNAGNVARLCAGAKIRLHLVGDLGFRLSNKSFQRAALDYWRFLEWQYFPDKQKYWSLLQNKNFYLFTTKAKTSYYNITFQKEDFLVFGSETRGLENQWLEKNSSRCFKIPILEPNIRSYNLSNCVAIIVFEAIRQIQLTS